MQPTPSSKQKTKKLFIEIHPDQKESKPQITQSSSINTLLRRFKSHELYSNSKKTKPKPQNTVTINLNQNSSQKNQKIQKCKSTFQNSNKIASYLNSGRKRNKIDTIKILNEESIQELDTEENNDSPIAITECYQCTPPSMENGSSQPQNRKLLLASKKGDKDSVILLLTATNPPNINYQDENGYSALHYACDEGNLKICEILIKHGADCNLKAIDKKTPLHLAAMNGYFDISKLIIENGGKMDNLDHEKNTPLHLCAMKNHSELLSFMMEKCECKYAKNLYGKTVFDLANEETKKVIRKFNLNSNLNRRVNKIKIYHTDKKQADTLIKSSMNVVKGKMKENIIKGNIVKTIKAANINKRERNVISANKKTVSKLINKDPKTSNHLQHANHSRSQSKNKNGFSVKKNTNANSGMKLTQSQRVSSVKKKQNTMLNHKTISLPKFSSTYMSSESKRGKSANKTNSIVSGNKIANVEISLDYNNGQNKNMVSNGSTTRTSNTITNNYHSTNANTNTNSNTATSNNTNANTNHGNEIMNLLNFSSDSNAISSDSSLDEHENNHNNEHEHENEQEKDVDQDQDPEQQHVGPSSFICLGLLGKGSFGEVYLVKSKTSDKLYAMKVLDKDRIMGQNIVKYAMTERNVLSLTSHPFIVGLNFAFQTKEKLFLLLDYCPNGDLAEQLSIETRFTEQKAKFYICEIILALGDLHNKNIIFRDLKPDNVVLDSEGHAMLTDFGLSREGVCNAKIAKSFCGSIAYLAPEMLSRSGHGKAVDWYLLGVLFYEMLVGIPPFFTNSKEQIFKNIEKGDLKIPGFVSRRASKLLRDLLVKDPNVRLGSKGDVEEIKQHEYFNDVDWVKVYNREMIPPKINTTGNVQMFKEPKLFLDDDEIEDKRVNGGNNNNNFEGWSFVQNNEKQCK